MVELLRGAERPLIIAGGGVQYSEAWAELAALAEQLGIPVCETSAGKGAFQGPAHLRLGGVGATGNPAAGQVASEADLVLCVGTRLTDFPTGSRSIFQHPEVRFAAINVDGHDAYKLRAHPVVADAREALTAIARACRRGRPAPERELRPRGRPHPRRPGARRWPRRSSRSSARRSPRPS